MEKKAQEILNANREKLDALAKVLFEHATMDSEEINELFDSDFGSTEAKRSAVTNLH